MANDRPFRADVLTGYEPVDIGTLEIASWARSMMGLPDVWTRIREAWEGQRTRVAVLDTGCDLDHPDIKENIEEAVDFSDSGGPTDVAGHGTHVAGTIGAHGWQHGGLNGVDPTCRLLIYKVLGDDGRGASPWIASAIDRAVDQEADVVNMSLGAFSRASEIRDAVARAASAGVVIFAAAGNEGIEGSPASWPAMEPGAISVAAFDRQRNRAPFSSARDDVYVAWPGVEVISQWTDGGYVRISGTSMATPFGAGVGSLVVRAFRLSSERPLQGVEQMKDRLRRNAIDLGDPGRDDETGYGFVRPEDAIEAIQSNA